MAWKRGAWHPWRDDARGGSGAIDALRDEREGGGNLGLVGRLGLPGRSVRKSKNISFLIKIEFLNMPMLWKFAQGNLGGILTCGFFLNSPRLLKDFKKIKYAMPCDATLGKIN
jgi:hypothetical protein